jgi:hypothetical protein
MSEATLTATVAAEATGVQEGTFVQFNPDGDGPQLAIVADAADGGTVQVIARCCPDDDELFTRAAARGGLTTPPGELDAAQQALAQHLVVTLVGQARDRTRQLEYSLAEAREDAGAARRTIESMRAYAIGKHLDGTICREGLNDFLAAHDLDLYEPRYTARVTASFDVEVYDVGNDYSATAMIRDRIEITSEDEDEVRITSDGGLDVSDVQLVAGE